MTHREWSPFVTYVERGTGTPSQGMYIEIWKTLEKRFNFTTKVTAVPDGINYEWSFMAKRVQDKEYSIGLTGFSQTLKRKLVIA